MRKTCPYCGGIMKLEQKHIDFMKKCATGLTIKNEKDVEIAREIQKFDPFFLGFIGPGCLLLHDGFSYISRWESENK